jgi:uncharacterized protein (TIGR00251 family)
MKIELKVIAGAKKEELIKVSENSYRLKVCSPPEKGRANRRAIELLSEKFNVKRQDIRIVSGETSARKILEICL